MVGAKDAERRGGLLGADQLQIDTITTGGPWGANCYLLTHRITRELVVVDPGDEARKIIEAITARDAMVRAILLTHAHFDHVGAAAELSRHFELPCQLHRDDLRLLRHAPMYAARFAQKRMEPVDSYATYDMAPSISIAGQDLSFYSCPGHTRGSVAMRLGDVVLTGDTLLNGCVGRTDLPGADLASLIASVQMLLQTLPPHVVVLPGHGAPWTVGQARAWWRSAMSDPPQYDRFEEPGR